MSLGGLLPGGAELHGAGEDAVVGSLVAGFVGGLDRRLGIDAEGLDRAGEALARLGEGADGRHGVLSCCSSGRAHRGLDGDRPAGGDRRRTRRCEPQRSGGWRQTAILLRDAKPLAAAENSWRPPLRHRRSRRSRPSARSGHPRQRGAHQTRTALERHVAALGIHEQGDERSRRAKTHRRAQTAMPADTTGRLTPRTCPALRNDGGNKAIGKSGNSFRRLATQTESHRATMIESRSAHHPSDPAAMITDRNRYASFQMTPGVRASPSTCVRDQARRGETAMPVRAQATSPARTETPTPLVSALVQPSGCPAATVAAVRFPVGSSPAMPSSQCVSKPGPGGCVSARYPDRVRW